MRVAAGAAACMHAGSCRHAGRFIHAMQMLLMRVWVRRAYGKKCWVHLQCSAIKVYLLEYIYLNNANVPFVHCGLVKLCCRIFIFYVQPLQTGSNYAPHNTYVSVL